jgi:hypothetical protein
MGESYSGFKVLAEQRQGNATTTNSDDSYDVRILGAHLLGTHAEEIINIFALAIRLGLNTADIKDTIFYILQNRMILVTCYRKPNEVICMSIPVGQLLFCFFLIDEVS